MTEQELTSLCAEWQGQLGLAHWHMAIRYGQRDEFEDDVMANATYHNELESALIKILVPNQYAGIFPQDTEQSIVHELLHILLSPLEPEGGFCGTQKMLSEQAIDRLARVLVALKRKAG